MTFPLTPQPEWDRRDSTKLTDYILCPRYYFFSHILGWRLDRPNHDLLFGEAWHIGREHQMIYGYQDTMGAFSKFMAKYREHLPPETDPIYLPKVPSAALAGYIEYATTRKHDLEEYEVVTIDGLKMTEISGTVPVDDKRVLYYKMDSVVRCNQDGMVESWDHKSTTESGLDPRWDNEYYLSIQNGTYTHCLYCMFPINQVRGVKFCKTGFAHLQKGSSKRPAGFYATIHDVPAYKNPDQMNVWLNNTIMILDEIDRDMDRLFHCKEEDSVLLAFRQNPKSCTAYRGCLFHDFCLSWINPLQRCHQPEIGFKVEFWDPSAIQSTVKKNLEIR
jgi:hypothetical protein